VSVKSGQNPSKVRAEFGEVGIALSAAIDFLSTEFKIHSLELLPHLQQVVALSFFFNICSMPSADQVAKLKKWFWKTSFSRRYSAQTDDKINADLKYMKELAKGENPGSDGYSSELNNAMLKKMKFTKGHPYTRALLLLLAQKSPLNLVNGARIELGEALSGFNQKEYHHVFPRAFLKKRGVAVDKMNALCNFCFLPAGSNKKISQRPPSDYIFNLVPEKDRKEILESNLMPLRMEIYTQDDYEQFISMRADLISQFVDSLVI
jgi:hypothetical protein